MPIDPLNWYKATIQATDGTQKEVYLPSRPTAEGAQPTDPTLSVPGMPADAEAVGFAFDVSDNKFDSAAYIDGYNISATGKITANDSWGFVETYIDVVGSDSVFVQNFSRNNGQFTASFWNEDTFISRSSVTNLNGSNEWTSSISVPASATKCRIAITKRSLNYPMSIDDNLSASLNHALDDYSKFGKIIRDDFLFSSPRLNTAVIQMESDIATKGKGFRICIIGDVHCGECGGSYNPAEPSAYGTTWDTDGSYAGASMDERMQLLVDTIRYEHSKRPFDFIVTTGDIAIEGGHSSQEDFNNPKWLEYFYSKYAIQLPCPLYIAPGNHDCFAEKDWTRCTGLPRQYSVETDDFYFVFMDTFSNITMGANMEDSTATAIGYDHIDFDFLENEYAKSGGKKFIVVAHAIQNNVYSELGKTDQDKMNAFVRNHNNYFATIVGHSHSYDFKKLWSAHYLNTNHFVYPTKKWADAYNDRSMLWSINVIEINAAGDALEHYYVQPEHNYVGMGFNHPYTVSSPVLLGSVTKSKAATFYEGRGSHGYEEQANSVLRLNRDKLPVAPSSWPAWTHDEQLAIQRAIGLLNGEDVRF